MVKIQKKQEAESIDESQKVKLVKMGHLLEVMAIENLPDGDFGITKIDKDHYVVNETGELKEYIHTEKRTENVDNLRRTFKQLRYLINNNFAGKPNELHVVLTYSGEMVDEERLKTDFKRFMDRLRYKYRKMSKVDYINVVEPRGDGTWHCHVLLRFNDIEKIYIPNECDKDGNPINAPLREMWGQGFVTIRSLKDIDNIGAYLSAYLGDIELSDDTIAEAYKHKNTLEIKTVEVDGIEKKFIKGARLHYYPTGMRIYRKSDGIKEPSIEWLYYHDVRKIVGSATPNYSKTIDILDEDEELLNSITYEQYNLKRK